MNKDIISTHTDDALYVRSIGSGSLSPLGGSQGIEVDPNDHPFDSKAEVLRLGGNDFIPTRDARRMMDMREHMEFHNRQRNAQARSAIEEGGQSPYNPGATIFTATEAAIPAQITQ